MHCPCSQFRTSNNVKNYLSELAERLNGGKSSRMGKKIFATTTNTINNEHSDDVPFPSTLPSQKSNHLYDGFRNMFSGAQEGLQQHFPKLHYLSYFRFLPHHFTTYITIFLIFFYSSLFILNTIYFLKSIKAPTSINKKLLQKYI